MENASKALLIAGAILLVIAIIGIGMAIFGQAQGVIDRGGQQIDTLAVQAHNSMFDAYVDKVVKGRTIKDLCAKIASYNQGADTAYVVTIYYYASSTATQGQELVNEEGMPTGTLGTIPKDGETATGARTLVSQIEASKNYKVEADIAKDSTTGIIQNIYIYAQ